MKRSGESTHPAGIQQLLWTFVIYWYYSTQQFIERQFIERQFIERQLIERQFIERQLIERQFIEPIVYRTINSLNDSLSKRQFIERQFVEPMKANLWHVFFVKEVALLV